MCTQYIHVLFSRVQLAALHYNENADRHQATMKDGKPLYRTTYVKWKQGAAVVRPVKEAATFGTIQLLVETMSLKSLAYTYLHTTNTEKNVTPTYDSNAVPIQY